MTYQPSDHVERHQGPDVVLELWHRRKWVALMVFVAAAVSVVTVTQSLPDLYRATASVLVERQQVSEAFVRPSVTAELETRIQTIHQQVMSRTRLTEIIARFGLYQELRDVVPFDAIVQRMRRDIHLELKGVEQATTGRAATIAFTLSYTGRDPETVAQVTNTLVTFYVDENAKSRERQAAGTAEFLKAQLAAIKQDLDAQEQRTSEFRSRHGVELPEHFASNLAALERLNTQLRLNGEYQIRILERRERLEQQLTDAAVKPAPAAMSLPTPATQLLKLKEELAELRRRFSDQYPDVIRLKADIAALERQLEQAGTNGEPAKMPAADTRLRHALAATDDELQALKEEDQFLRQAISGYEARIENAPKRQDEFQQLARDSEITKERYGTLLKRYEEAQLAESLEQGHSVEQFRILDPAIPPNEPAAPRRGWLLVMGLIASAALAFGAVVGAEKLDTTFHTVDDLRAFIRVPTLATIGVIVTKSDRRRQRRRFALMAVVAIASLVAIAAGSHYLAAGNEHILRLTVRVLR